MTSCYYARLHLAANTIIPYYYEYPITTNTISLRTISLQTLYHYELYHHKYYITMNTIVSHTVMLSGWLVPTRLHCYNISPISIYHSHLFSFFLYAVCLHLAQLTFINLYSLLIQLCTFLQPLGIGLPCTSK